MKQKTLFYCTACGNEFPKWAGKCPACGAWNTIVEQPETPKSSRGSARSAAGSGLRRRACPVTELGEDEEIRFPTGMGELDRVLGGGAVKGSLVLVGGSPGIGKSTLMLQICSCLCAFSKVLYVSGEESEHQLKLRAKRLRVESPNLLVISETALGDLLETVSEEKPDVLIVDSIQTLYADAVDSPAGSVSQVKECTMALMQLAKGQGITVFVMEGARPVLAEIQALVVSSAGGNPRRTSNGFDYNRAAMLLAVLEKRGGLKVSACDAYLNIIGGLYLDEPAADLAAVIALASSYLDRPVPGDLAAVGEVGLTGELRSVNQLDQRISEVRRLGFCRCVVPAHRAEGLRAPDGLQVIAVRNIGDSLRGALRGQE